ncbi:MAG: hypothetical protein JNM75_06135 [Rhodospirillales bacterium]|nr:hypothetical protein [Rhodospirillales bacterium]
MIRATTTSVFAPALLVLAMLAGGCTSPERATVQLADIRFTDAPPITLDVKSIEVDTGEAADSARRDRDVGDGLTHAPDVELRQWALDRLRTAGRAGVARFEILSARVEEEKLPRAEGFAGLFGSPPGAVYTMTAEAQLEIDAADGRSAIASAKVVRTRSIEGNRTREERRRFFSELTETTMAEFDQQMEGAIRQHLNPWVL